MKLVLFNNYKCCIVKSDDYGISISGVADFAHTFYTITELFYDDESGTVYGAMESYEMYYTFFVDENNMQASHLMEYLVCRRFFIHFWNKPAPYKFGDFWIGVNISVGSFMFAKNPVDFNSWALIPQQKGTMSDGFFDMSYNPSTNDYCVRKKNWFLQCKLASVKRVVCTGDFRTFVSQNYDYIYLWKYFSDLKLYGALVRVDRSLALAIGSKNFLKIVYMVQAL